MTDFFTMQCRGVHYQTKCMHFLVKWIQFHLEVVLLSVAKSQFAQMAIMLGQGLGDFFHIEQ